jgi:outer membrane protein assembly factor BamA
VAPRTRLAVGLVVLLVGRAAAAQDVTCDPGDTEVRALAFRGNQTFRDDQLEIGIETTQSTWWRRTFRFIGRAYCLDSVAVATDSIRLQSFYQRHGFADVQVSYDITHTGRSSARVTFNIDEGRPLLVDSLTFQGLDSVADRERLLRDLPLHTGGRFDRVWLDPATRCAAGSGTTAIRPPTCCAATTPIRTSIASTSRSTRSPDRGCGSAPSTS